MTFDYLIVAGMLPCIMCALHMHGFLVHFRPDLAKMHQFQNIHNMFANRISRVFATAFGTLKIIGGIFMLIRRTAWTQAIAWIGRLCNRLRRGFRPSYLQYRSPEDERKYWMSSEQLRRVLQSSDANNTPRTVPLMTYYMPKLLPVYRSALEKYAEAREYNLSARTFCKWHRIVFPGPVHPTIEQAARLVKHYSSRDRQEMYRISRMLTDEEVFGRTASWTPRYREMWRQWLRKKGPDIAIVFE